MQKLTGKICCGRTHPLVVVALVDYPMNSATRTAECLT
jgi:hypothetical protein